MSQFKSLHERTKRKRRIHLSSANAQFHDLSSTYYFWKLSLTDIPEYKRQMEALLSLLNDGSRSDPLNFPDLDLWGPHGAWDYIHIHTLPNKKEEIPREISALRCFLAICAFSIVPGMERYLNRFYDLKHIDEETFQRHKRILKQIDVALNSISQIKSCEEIKIRKIKTDYYQQLGMDGKLDIEYDRNANVQWRSASHFDYTVTIIMFDPYQSPLNRALALYLILLDKVGYPGGTAEFMPRELLPKLKKLIKGQDPVADKCLELAVDLLPPPPKKPDIDETAYF